MTIEAFVVDVVSKSSRSNDYLCNANFVNNNLAKNAYSTCHYFIGIKSDVDSIFHKRLFKVTLTFSICQQVLWHVYLFIIIITIRSLIAITNYANYLLIMWKWKHKLCLPNIIRLNYWFWRNCTLDSEVVHEETIHSRVLF